MALGFGLLLLSVPYFFVKSKSKQIDKFKNYESGFDPLSPNKTPFNVRFYLVAILFVLFDVEIIFLLLWALAYKMLGVIGFFVAMLFIIILTIGFIYEWKKGALEWD
jgi:NADH-quinone oxidoreductase subunit A